MRKGQIRKKDRRLQLVDKLRSIDTSQMSIKEIWSLPFEGMNMFHDYRAFWAFLQKFNIPYKTSDSLVKLQSLDTKSMEFDEIHAIIGGPKHALRKVALKHNIPYKDRRHRRNNKK